MPQSTSPRRSSKSRTTFGGVDEEYVRRKSPSALHGAPGAVPDARFESTRRRGECPVQASDGQRQTHQEALTRTIRSLGGTWDTQRAVTALHGAGFDVGDKRARQVLRDIAGTGLLVKDDPDRAVYTVYRTDEQ